MTHHLSLATLLSVAALAGCAPLTDADLNDDFSVAEGCGVACTTESELVGSTYPLTSHAHDVVGDLVIVDDRTLRIDNFGFDGGGLDVRAIVGLTSDDLYERETRTVLSDDLRRPGGYDNVSVSFSLPDAVDLDDVGHFAIWCIPANVVLGDTAL